MYIGKYCFILGYISFHTTNSISCSGIIHMIQCTVYHTALCNLQKQYARTKSIFYFVRYMISCIRNDTFTGKMRVYHQTSHNNLLV